MTRYLCIVHFPMDYSSCYMYNVTIGHIIKASRKDVPYDERKKTGNNDAECCME